MVSCVLGWTEEEVAVLRLLLMKVGVGRWSKLAKFLPGKTVAQINLQTQRLMGQQSLGEFTNLRIDPDVIRARNAQVKDAKRKNGFIVNTGKNMTVEERARKRKENKVKYGIAQEVADAIVIPKLRPPEEVLQAQQGNSRAAQLSQLRVMYQRLEMMQERLVELDKEEAKEKENAAAESGAAGVPTQVAAEGNGEVVVTKKLKSPDRAQGTEDGDVEMQ